MFQIVPKLFCPSLTKLQSKKYFFIIIIIIIIIFADALPN